MNRRARHRQAEQAEQRMPSAGREQGRPSASAARAPAGGAAVAAIQAMSRQKIAISSAPSGTRARFDPVARPGGEQRARRDADGEGREAQSESHYSLP